MDPANPDTIGGFTSPMLSALVFLAVGTLAFAVMIGICSREAVRRRAAQVRIEDDGGGGRRALRYSGLRAAQKLIDYTAKHYTSVDSKDIKVLRQRLVRAGIYDPRGPAYFFLARVIAAVGLAALGFFMLPEIGVVANTPFWMFVMLGALMGYLAPSFYLDRMIGQKRLEHQAG